MDLSFFKKHILVLVMKNKRQMSSKVKCIFLMEKNSSCGVVIAYCMSKPFTLVNQFIVGNSRVIVIEDKIDDIIFALINIYNSNIKT